MWLQRFTHFLLQNRWRALVITFVSTFVPVIGIIGVLIAALVTLVKGIKEGAIFMIAATLPYVISFYAVGGQEPAMPIAAWAAVGVAVLSNVLTWVFGCMLYRKATWAVILQVAALVGVLAISLVHVFYPDVANWWGVELQNYYSHAQSVTDAIKGADKSVAEQAALTSTQIETINGTKYMATGFIVAAILFNAILQLIVARWWQAALFQPGSLRRELRGIRLSQLAGTLFIVSLILWRWDYLENHVVNDLMPVMLVLFCTAGLSLVHFMFGFMHSPTVWFWLVLFYMLLIYAMPISIVMIGILALLDVWFDIRKRLRKI